MAVINWDTGNTELRIKKIDEWIAKNPQWLSLKTPELKKLWNVAYNKHKTTEEDYLNSWALAELLQRKKKKTKTLSAQELERMAERIEELEEQISSNYDRLWGMRDLAKKANAPLEKELENIQNRYGDQIKKYLDEVNEDENKENEKLMSDGINIFKETIRSGCFPITHKQNQSTYSKQQWGSLYFYITDGREEKVVRFSDHDAPSATNVETFWKGDFYQITERPRETAERVLKVLKSASGDKYLGDRFDGDKIKEEDGKKLC